MFGKNYVSDLINRSAENPADRRRFLKTASAAGLGVVGAAAAASVAGPARPRPPVTSPTRFRTGRSSTSR